MITLTVFAVFSVMYMNEEFKWNYAVGFFFIAVVRGVCVQAVVKKNLVIWRSGDLAI